MDAYAYSFDSISLLPRKAKVSSRGLADVSVHLGNKKFNLPITPSNMKCVIDEDTAKVLSEADYFYVMHRYDIDILKFVTRANEEQWKTISISLGLKDIDSTLLERLNKYNLRIDYITIDVAHGHSDSMYRMLHVVKEQFPNAFIIAGNVATQGGVGDLQDWGADAVKVGFGGGSPCSTKYKTGFTCPMFSCVKDCASIASVPFIADGGIKHNGDIAKALVAGASFCMAGGMFAACYDSPADIVYPGPNTGTLSGYSKRYFGSASHQNKGERRHIEGFEVLIKGNEMRYMEKLEEITQDLQSAVSYAGGTDLSSMDRVYYVINR